MTASKKTFIIRSLCYFIALFYAVLNIYIDDKMANSLRYPNEMEGK